MTIPENPKIIIIGSGAREHALAWKLAQSAHRPMLWAAPGNPGMRALATCVPIAVGDTQALVQFAVDHAIDLVVIGPEQPLANGLVDVLADAGIAAFGPDHACAQLEASKAFAKEMMAEANIPTASHRVFTDASEAAGYIHEQGAPIVVKADGLAAGKGVIVATTVEEAIAAAEDMLAGNRFGDAGAKVVIESFLSGEEVSLMYFVDGGGFAPMVTARDYKRIGEGNTGPNTGGMGAFAPVPGCEELADVVSGRIVQPLLHALQSRGLTYRGVLYVGLMLTEDGPYVVEFNARFGDPETQVVLPLLKTDLLDVVWAVAHDGLRDLPITWHDEAAVCVVLAARGYPDGPQTGDVIEIARSLQDASQPVIFHAGTRLDEEGSLRTSGGRVLAVSARGRSIDQARGIAYQAADAIYFDGKTLRRDIAQGVGGVE